MAGDAVRPREFVQTGIESYGAADPAKADAEIMALTVEAIRAAGLRAFKLRLGDSPSRDIARVQAVRAAVGDEVAILTDKLRFRQLQQAIGLPHPEFVAVGADAQQHEEAAVGRLDLLARVVLLQQLLLIVQLHHVDHVPSLQSGSSE